MVSVAHVINLELILKVIKICGSCGKLIGNVGRFIMVSYASNSYHKECYDELKVTKSQVGLKG